MTDGRRRPPSINLRSQAGPAGSSPVRPDGTRLLDLAPDARLQPHQVDPRTGRSQFQPTWSPDGRRSPSPASGPRRPPHELLPQRQGHPLDPLDDTPGRHARSPAHQWLALRGSAELGESLAGSTPDPAPCGFRVGVEADRRRLPAFLTLARAWRRDGGKSRALPSARRCGRAQYAASADRLAILALTGSRWVPSPCAISAPSNGTPSIAPRIFTSPRVPKSSATSPITTHVHAPGLSPL